MGRHSDGDWRTYTSLVLGLCRTQRQTTRHERPLRFYA